MQRRLAMQTLIRCSLILTFTCLLLRPADAAGLTQRDWMITLVDTLGWSYGLPDEPQDPDYINILTGNRMLRLEAEDSYAEDEDNVSLLDFPNFGAFGGRGWLSGGREPTTVHLRFNLPLAGSYQLQAHLRQPGHRFDVNGRVTTVDAGPDFTEVSIGHYDLPAGRQEIRVTLPAGGAIDYITLAAPNLAVITPAAGWQPDEPLTWQVMQTTLLQLLHLADLFPEAAPLVYEAENLDQGTVQAVSIPHLGRVSGSQWLRAGPVPAEVRFPVRLPESGFYDLSLRVLGSPIDISVGSHQTIRLEAKAYLDDYTFKSLFFFAGATDIAFRLPPGGGIDRMSLTGRDIDPARVNQLFGLERTAAPGAGDLDHLASLLAAFGVER